MRSDFTHKLANLLLYLRITRLKCLIDMHHEHLILLHCLAYLDHLILLQPELQQQVLVIVATIEAKACFVPDNMEQLDQHVMIFILHYLQSTTVYQWPQRVNMHICDRLTFPDQFRAFLLNNSSQTHLMLVR